MLDSQPLEQNADDESTEVIYTLEDLRALHTTSSVELTAVTEREPEYRTLNFFRGGVTEDRIVHETRSQHGALAHWRHNGSKQSEHDGDILRNGVDPSKRYDRNAQRNLPGYSVNTAGMGLENENLYSFITRTRQNVIPITANEGAEEPAAEPVVEEPSVEENDKPIIEEPAIDETAPHAMPEVLLSGAPAPAILFKFRRMKTATFTNLLARALNQ